MMPNLRRLLLLMMASAALAGAFGLSAFGEEYKSGDRLNVYLSDAPSVISFTPEANSDYAVCLLPAGEGKISVRATILMDGMAVAEGEGAPLAVSARLNAGKTYALSLTGTGEAVLEISRNALSRCFTNPIQLADGGEYSKLVAAAGDAHFYRVTALSAGLATLAALPEDDGLSLSLTVMDEAGHVLASGAPREIGAAAAYAAMEAGETWLIRVAAGAGETGQYRLKMIRSDNAAPTGVSLSSEALNLSKGDVAGLTAAVAPEGAFDSVFFATSNSAVAAVTQAGLVTARGPGIATVTAYAYGGVSASCMVTVGRVPLVGVAFESDRLTLKAGEEAPLSVLFYPEDASYREVRYVSSNSDIATVTGSGVVKGVSQGTATITVTSLEGGYEDMLVVHVTAAAPGLRALLVGEQNYLENVNTQRVGSVNSVNAMAHMLGEIGLRGGAYQTETLLDGSAEDVLSAIERAFAGAEEGDVSLLYITCHGFYEDGMSFFQMSDGSLLPARTLEAALRRVKGDVVVIADCCGSGGVLGEASAPEDFNRGVISAFSGTVGASAFASDKYRVLASAALDQDSYRVSFGETAREGEMATVFARALCDGAGWSLEQGRRSALRADVDYNRQLTLNEIWLYTARRVRFYLNMAQKLSGTDTAYAQNVQVFPQDDARVLFER